MGGIVAGIGTSVFGSGVVKAVGKWCPTTRFSALAGSSTAGPALANKFQLSPFIPAFSFSTTQISYFVGAAGGVGTLLDLAIYDTATTTGEPNNLLASASGIVADVANARLTNINVNFFAGVLYWIGVISNGTVSLNGLSTGGIDITSPFSSISAPGSTIATLHTYGTIPAIWPYGAGSSDPLPMTTAYKFLISG